MKYAFLSLLFAIASPAFGQLKIVTTTTDHADLAKQIGRDRVSVHSVMKGPENVHNVLAKPTEMLKLNQADVFLHSGLDAEPWRDNLIRGARNPRIIAGKPGNVDLSIGVTLRDVPTGKIDRSGGDLHAYGNTHYTLSPANAQQMVVTIVRALADIDPANADFYRSNAKTLIADLADLHREVRKTFEPYAGLKVVTFHKAWDYFADSVGLQVVGTIEPQAAITPSPAQIRRTIEFCRREGVKVILCETYSDTKLAQSIAEQAGATMIVLPDHVLGVAAADSYQALFRYNVKRLIDAAAAVGVEPAPPAPVHNTPSTASSGAANAH